MATVGRNDPCPCGSGKKYKKCCLSKDTAIDLESFREERAEESLRGEIMKFAMGERFKKEMTEAFQAYRGGEADASLMLMSQDPLENIRFIDWFVHEHKHSKENKSIIDMFAELRSKTLDETEQKLLAEWRASRLGAFEVESVKAGVLKLSNVFGEGSYSIEDPEACEELEAGMVVVARVTSSWGVGKLGGAPIMVPAESKQKLIDAVNEDFDKHKKDDPDADLSKFAAEHSHLVIAAAAKLA